MGTGIKKKRTSLRKAGGARRDRTADLLHAMQALSQLSYGPTWRRGTLPDMRSIVKKGRSRRAALGGPQRLCLVQPRQGLILAQNGQRGIDGRRDRASAHGDPDGLGEFAEVDAFGRANLMEHSMHRFGRPSGQVLQSMGC